MDKGCSLEDLLEAMDDRPMARESKGIPCSQHCYMIEQLMVRLSYKVNGRLISEEAEKEEKKKKSRESME